MDASEPEGGGGSEREAKRLLPPSPDEVPQSGSTILVCDVINLTEMKVPVQEPEDELLGTRRRMAGSSVNEA